MTSLPFDGQNPTNILIQNEGDGQPEFQSLWLCGLPTDGAGNDDASDCTNPDGSCLKNSKMISAYCCIEIKLSY